MKKYILPLTLTVLLAISAVLNVLQYNNANQIKNKLLLFESNIGTYEEYSQRLRENDEAIYNHARTVNVYFVQKAGEGEIQKVRNLIETQDTVESVKYTSAADALAKYLAANKDNKSLLEALKVTENVIPATLEVVAKDPTQKPSLIKLIKDNDTHSIVEKVF